MSDLNETIAGWVQPFRRFDAYVQDITNLVRLTESGSFRVRMMPELYGVLEPHLSQTPDLTRKKAQAEELAALAKDQAQKGFPVLYGHSLIALWGALEVLTQDLAVAWLEHQPNLLTADPLGDIKLTVGDFHSLAGSDLLRHIIIEAQRTLKTDLKVGRAQLEALMDWIGLGGELDSRAADGLFYMQQYRNLLAHRGGIADRRFVARCPAAGYSRGQQVLVGPELFSQFLATAYVYAATLHNRCRSADGMQVIDLAIPPSFGYFVGPEIPVAGADQSPSTGPEPL